MKKKKLNIGLLVAVILISALLLYWLFAVTLIDEDANLDMMPVQTEQGQ